jgi:hypothetical protein
MIRKLFKYLNFLQQEKIKAIIYTKIGNEVYKRTDSDSSTE